MYIYIYIYRIEYVVSMESLYLVTLGIPLSEVRGLPGSCFVCD